MKVIIESTITSDAWHETLPPELRVYALSPFWTETGIYVPKGDVGEDNFHLAFPCELSGNNRVLIPTLELDSTPLDQNARYTAILVSTNGSRRQYTYLSNFTVPENPTPTTWNALRINRKLGAMRFINPPLAEIQQLIAGMIASALTFLRYGSPTQSGMVRPDTASIDPTAPYVVSTTNPNWQNIGNLPSATEKAALAGTAGAPGDANRYVTDADTRIDPATPDSLGISQLSVGAPDPAQPRVVTDNDTRLTNARPPTGPAGGKLRGSYPSPELSPTGVAAGAYRAPIMTIDEEGRISAAQTGLNFPQPSVADADGTLAGATTIINTIIDRLEVIGLLTAPLIPGAPSNLTATPVSTSRIDLNWTDNSTDEVEFRIERKTPGGVFAQIDTVGPGVTAYQNTGLTTDTTYVYRVRAFNGTNNSAYSNEVNISTLGPVFAPALYASFFQEDNAASIPNADTGQVPVVLHGTLGTKQYAAYCTVAQANSRAYETGQANGVLSFQIISAGVTAGLVIRADATRYILVRFWNANWDASTALLAGGGAIIASGSLPAVVSAGDWLAVQFNGPDYTILKNGVPVATFATAVNETATQHGLYIDGPDPNAISPGARAKHLLFSTAVPSLAGSIQITKPASYKVFQRNGSNQADIVISGTYTGSPSSLEARYNNGPWKTITDAPSGGVFSGTLTAQAQGQGWLEMRFGNDHAIISRIPYIGIGDVYVIAGQSNAEGRISTPQFYSHATLRTGVHDHGGDTVGPGRWREAYDPTDSSETAPYNNSVWPLLATQLMAAIGVPVGFITTAHGQTGFFGDGATWTPPSGNTYLEMINAIQQAETGGVKAILWYQGESDARGETNEAGYIAALEGLRSSAQAALGLANLKLIVAQLSHLAVAGFTRATIDPIRQAQVNASAAHANILVGPILYDLDTCVGGAADCIHITTPAHALIEATRWAHMLKFHFYGVSAGRGPRFLSAVRVDSTHIDVSFTVGAGLTLLPAVTDTKAGWRVVNSDTQAVLVISSALRQADTSVRLTMAAPLPTNVKVSWASFNDAVNVALTDSHADAMPAEPFIDKVVP